MHLYNLTKTPTEKTIETRIQVIEHITITIEDGEASTLPIILPQYVLYHFNRNSSINTK